MVCHSRNELKLLAEVQMYREIMGEIRERIRLALDNEYHNENELFMADYTITKCLCENKKD